MNGAAGGFEKLEITVTEGESMYNFMPVIMFSH